MANLADTISAGIKDAMRAKDRERLSALRDIKSKIMLEATKRAPVTRSTTPPLWPF